MTAALQHYGHQKMSASILIVSMSFYSNSVSQQDNSCFDSSNCLLLQHYYDASTKTDHICTLLCQSIFIAIHVVNQQ